MLTCQNMTCEERTIMIHAGERNQDVCTGDLFQVNLKSGLSAFRVEAKTHCNILPVMKQWLYFCHLCYIQTELT